MAAGADISEGARELVDLTAEAVEGMGQHLAQIGDIITQSAMPPKQGDRGASKRCRDKLDFFKAFCTDIARRRKEAEAKMDEDFERLREWRKEAGSEGKSMMEEMETLLDDIRAQKKLLEIESSKACKERQKVHSLILSRDRQVQRKACLGESFVQRVRLSRAETLKRAALCSWLQCSFDNIRFRFKAEQEAQQLKIEYLRKLRKARAQSRLDCIHGRQTQQLLQACLLSLQEETVERRRERHLEELCSRHEDRVLVLEAQVAQALGDEETAKDLIQEQVRRLEEARDQAKEAERKMRLAQREAREAKAEADEARQQRAEALEAKAAAEARAAAAETDAEEARGEAADANARAEELDAARASAEKSLRKAEDEIKKKTKKIASLQRMLAEVGAESDSDAPPDERPPAFFVNEDGTKVPRPRTRKERMGMAYREAESARWELRLGMAATIDKDFSFKGQIERLRWDLEAARQEVVEVRSANESLTADAEALAMSALSVLSDASTQTSLPAAMPLQASSTLGAQAPFLRQVPGLDTPSTSPRLHARTASQPVFAPCSAELENTELPSPNKLVLAPSQAGPEDGTLQGHMAAAQLYGQIARRLRKLKRPPHEWRAGWH